MKNYHKKLNDNFKVPFLSSYSFILFDLVTMIVGAELYYLVSVLVLGSGQTAAVALELWQQFPILLELKL